MTSSKRDRQEKLRIKLITMIVTAAVALFAGGATQTMPVVQLAQDGASVTLVRCGFGEYRGRFGGCRHNRGPRGAIRRSITARREAARPVLFAARVASAIAE